MGREVRARIEQLREKMAERGMDAYLIPTSDFHGSEYVSGYFKCRKYMTGFTGSAGTAVITMEDAGLWTDGRYFVQAAAELSGSGVELYRSGQEGVPTTLEFLKKHMPEQGVLGFDGRVVDTAEGERIAKALSGKKVRISEGEDLVGSIWDDRPALPMNPVWILEEKYAGKSAEEKIADLRGEMKKRQATVHLLTSLDDIAWLLNIRGDDIVHTPVVLSYLIVTKQELFLFIHEKTLNEEVRAYLHGLGVRIMPYEAVYQIASAFRYEREFYWKSRRSIPSVPVPGCERESDRGDESDGSGKSSQKFSGTGKYAPCACAGRSGIDPFPALGEGTCRRKRTGRVDRRGISG